MLKLNANRVLAVSLIPLLPKAMTDGELLHGGVLERKELGMEGKMGEVTGKGNLSLNSVTSGSSQALWWLRPCSALDFCVNLPFDPSPVEFGVLQLELYKQSRLLIALAKSRFLSDSCSG